MTLQAPFLISSRLLPAVKVGDVTISINFCNSRTPDNRLKFRYFIDGPNLEYTADDIKSGCGDRYVPEALQQAMETLLAFLEHDGEVYRANMTRHTALDEDESSFPGNVQEWAYMNSDEIGSLRLELEERKGLITA